MKKGRIREKGPNGRYLFMILSYQYYSICDCIHVLYCNFSSVRIIIVLLCWPVLEVNLTFNMYDEIGHYQANLDRNPDNIYH